MGDSANQPTVYVIAGPNGAGKTTFANEFLPASVECRHFLNADLIAAGLSPFAPETQNMLAGRLLLGRIDELVEARENFSFETILAGRAYVKLLRDIRGQDYRVVLFFLRLPTVELAIDRVASRVRRGGHNIAEVDIRRRFTKGIRNLLSLYRPLLDEWWLLDASRLPPATIAVEKDRQLVVERQSIFNSIQVSLKD